MFNCSHSRRSYPFDKMIPKDLEKECNSRGKAVIKKMHIKKQRQHNKKVIEEQ